MLRDYLRLTIDCIKTHGIVIAVKKAIILIKCKLNKEQNPGLEENITHQFPVEGSNLEQFRSCHNPEFIQNSDDSYTPRDCDAKLIAWYYPNFYKIESEGGPSNKNSLELDNVSRNVPLYNSSFQSQFSEESGICDLSMYADLKWQVELAKKYGIFGYCIDCCFSDAEITQNILGLILKNKTLNIHYCLNLCIELCAAICGEKRVQCLDCILVLKIILIFLKIYCSIFVMNGI